MHAWLQEENAILHALSSLLAAVNIEWLLFTQGVKMQPKVWNCKQMRPLIASSTAVLFMQPLLELSSQQLNDPIEMLLYFFSIKIKIHQLKKWWIEKYSKWS